MNLNLDATQAVDLYRVILAHSTGDRGDDLVREFEQGMIDANLDVGVPLMGWYEGRKTREVFLPLNYHLKAE